jgi:hypothetical protein
MYPLLPNKRNATYPIFPIMQCTQKVSTNANACNAMPSLMNELLIQIIGRSILLLLRVFRFLPSFPPCFVQLVLRNQRKDENQQRLTRRPVLEHVPERV